jgi:hypothetical protein
MGTELTTLNQQENSKQYSPRATIAEDENESGRKEIRKEPGGARFAVPGTRHHRERIMRD